MLTEIFNCNIMVYSNNDGKLDYVMNIIPGHHSSLKTVKLESEVENSLKQLLDDWVKK